MRKKDQPIDIISPYLARWEIIILFLSLIISSVSLWMSFQASKVSALPNIQVQSVEGSRNHEAQVKGDKSIGELITIQCTAVLKNAGNAPVQIVNVRWEPLITNDQMDKSKQWLAISDYFDPLSEATRDYFWGLRTNPVQAIKDTILSPDETKKLKIVFHGESVLEEGKDVPNIRVIFVFSNGQELTILPDIKYSGVSISF